jgi:histidine ammonia-lyase
MPRPVLLTGRTLTRREFDAVVFEGRRMALAPGARRAMAASRAAIERMIREGEVVYGVTTGVGSLSTARIQPAEALRLQLNIVRSHACGVGEPLEPEAVRGVLLLRANGLASGLSGVRPVVAHQLCEFLNRDILPIIPSRGSVGASGDLAPLAHVALALVGEGEATYRGKRLSSAAALARAGLGPLELQAKEGLSLVNGTQVMTALGLVALRRALILVDTADVAGALSLDALRGSPAAFDERLQRARPHPGQLVTARNLLRLNRGSSIRRSHLGCARVQDAYSLRCMPQVHGAVRDALGYLRRVLEIEMNSATDNPLVFAVRTSFPRKRESIGEGEVLSGGNFHGAPLALALDLAAVALAQLGSISERRTDRMVNPLTSDLPPFLARSPGLESGLMLVQVVAAALVSENKLLAHPASVDSIPTSGNKEDFVSMGMGAALKLGQILKNLGTILAIELIVAAEGIGRLAPLETGRLAEVARKRVRRAVRPLLHDRALSADIARLTDLVRDGVFAAILS